MPDARKRLLDAFGTLLVDHGDRAATLDAVAVAAGVSKGGLIYHFPSRDALIAAFLERAAEKWERQLHDALANGRSTAEFHLSPVSEADAALARALLALPQGELEHGQAGLTLRALLASWAERLRDEADDPIRAELIRLVGDGLLLNAMVGQTPDADLLHGIRERLLPDEGR